MVLKYEVPWWLTHIGEMVGPVEKMTGGRGEGRIKMRGKGDQLKEGIGNKLAITVKTLQVENVTSVAVWFIQYVVCIIIVSV